MTYMFWDATSFNQDLCAWTDTFPYHNAYCIFLEYACTYQDNPQFDRSGPFCASSTCPDDNDTPCVSDKDNCGCSHVQQSDYRGTVDTADDGVSCERWDADWIADTFDVGKYSR